MIKPDPQSGPHSALSRLEQALLEKATHAPPAGGFHYAVPGLWLGENAPKTLVPVDPYQFYLDVVREAKRQQAPPPSPPNGGEWSKDGVIYNMFIRTATAIDHNGNGILDLPLNEDGFRETGTFLKALAMLPYIKRLGATVIHLLPITSIGQDGNKGTLGSPYAIRNPYELDPGLSEPVLGLDVKTQFQAFVEAAHAMGFRIVVEFVFRTAAKDGDWVKEHPDWFYWIREEIPQRTGGETDEHKYGSPLFTAEELGRIHEAVNNGRFAELPPPHQEFRNFFLDPPSPDLVERVQGAYVGVTPSGERAKIPGAFADWPPDDNQPPWNDVTYLKMYVHPDYNYIGYNTIRMYDARLAREEYVNRPLWNSIVGIVPYYQREFGIDGVMIDMGHALPMSLKAEMVRTAREINPDFAFWDENFSISLQSREEGYNAVFGYLWHVQHLEQYAKEFLWRLHNETLPIPFFATSESHNTHRAASRPGGVTFARWTLVVNMFLPGIPFLHSGFELGEEYPINTGLDFSGEELQQLPSEKLPLFSEYGFDWTRPTQFSEFIARVARVRERYHDLIVTPNHETFRMLEQGNPAVVAFARVPRSGGPRLAVLSNANCLGREDAHIHLGTDRASLIDLLSGRRFAVEAGAIDLHLLPGEAVVVEY
jgi:glycosidase